MFKHFQSQSLEKSQI